MSNIKIFVTHSPNCDSRKLDGNLFYNVIAGSDFQKGPVREGFYSDNTGENISSKNKSYCELTTQYWAWKNQEADYFGFCHYRRVFNFNEKKHNESCWGTIEYDYLNKKTIEELCLSEDSIKAYVEKYDFLISKGISTDNMQAKNVFNQYENAPELHIEDVKLLLQIIERKYPFLTETASRFFSGKVFYPCNMFIMKDFIFNEYCTILFDVLNEYEKYANIQNYSREGYRTIGHLGERMLGIYYLYLKEKKNVRLGEIQIALIRNTNEMPAVIPVKKGIIPIVLAANQKYVPILYVCIYSLIKYFNIQRKYNIFVFHTDILKDSEKKFIQDFDKENVEMQFINIGREISGHVLQAKQHISQETFYRFLILDILKDWPKVIYLDCDTIICKDIAELYDISIDEKMIAATFDPDFAGQCNKKNSEMKRYCQNVLGLNNPFHYFQAGVLLMNIPELRKNVTVDKLLEMSETGVYRFSDQDILNIVCKDKVCYLDMRWNLLSDCNHARWHEVIKSAPFYILDAYEEARSDPYIIHYAGFLKPWMKPDEDYANKFWEIARETSFYEVLLWKLLSYNDRSFGDDGEDKEGDSFWLSKLRKVMRHFFPQNSKARTWAISIYFKLKNI